MDSTLDHRDEELETKVQELFTAKRTIERLNANLEHLEQENEFLKSALAEERQQLEEAKKNEDKHKHDELHREMIAEIRQELDEAQVSEKALREENVRLEKRLQQALENSVANISTHTDLDAEEIFTLTSQVSQLEEEKAQLQAELLEMSMKIQQRTDENARLQHEMAEKDEELECIESQFSTQCDISERLRQENQQLKAQFEIEAGQVDETRKGNSLFSEVDDRRVAAESKVVQIHQQMTDLEEKLTQEQKENKRLKHQVAFLWKSSKKGFDEDAVKGLQEQLVQCKKTIADMTEKLGKQELSNKHQASIEYRRPAAGVADDDKHYITFLEGLIRKKTKELGEVRSQAHRSHLQNVLTDLLLTQANNDRQVLGHEMQQLKLRNSHLAMTLKDLQQKYGESDADIPSPGSRRQSSKFKGVGKTTAAAAPPISGRDGSTSRLKSDVSSKSSEEASVKFSQANKENVRLRDLFNLTDIAAGKEKHSSKESGRQPKGVQLSQDVTILTSDGSQSAGELREDGTAGKIKHVKGGRGGGKFDSVTYENVSDEKPTECNQQ